MKRRRKLAALASGCALAAGAMLSALAVSLCCFFFCFRLAHSQSRCRSTLSIPPPLLSVSSTTTSSPLFAFVCMCLHCLCVCVYAIIPSSHAAFCRLVSFAFHLGCLVAVSVSGRYGGNLKSALEATAFVSSTAAGRGDWAGTVPYDEGWAVRAERSSAGNVLISDSRCELAGR
jgi:hypothetical protein